MSNRRALKFDGNGLEISVLTAMVGQIWLQHWEDYRALVVSETLSHIVLANRHREIDSGRSQMSNRRAIKFVEKKTFRCHFDSGKELNILPRMDKGCDEETCCLSNIAKK